MTTWRERARLSVAGGDSTSYRAWVEQNKEAARQEVNRRSLPMGKYKTKRGDSVDLPEGTSALRDQADTAYRAAVEAFDAIQEAKRRNAALSKTSRVDRGRFPALGGE